MNKFNTSSSSSSSSTTTAAFDLSHLLPGMPNMKKKLMPLKENLNSNDNKMNNFKVLDYKKSSSSKKETKEVISFIHNKMDKLSERYLHH